MLICVVGRSGSGKDYLAKKLGIPMVVSYTTRNKRDNETNGVEHWFISRAEMELIKKNESMIAYTKIGDVEYCALERDVRGLDRVYIIDGEGIEWLKKYGDYNGEMKVIYVYSDLASRIERTKLRSDHDAAFKKRCESENEQFDKFERNKEWDIFIDNSIGKEWDINDIHNRLFGNSN